MNKLRKGLFWLCTSATACLLVGCGGSGSSGAGGAGGSGVAAVVPATVNVTLPTGYKIPAGGLLLSGGLFSETALPTGKTQVSIKAWNSGHELVGVVDSNGNPILLGWIGGSNTVINTRTTADVLTYFAIEGFGAPNENQEALLTAISAQSGGNTVAADVATDVAAGRNLGSSGVAFAADLKSLAAALVGGAEPAVAQALAPAPAAAPVVEHPALVASISPDPSTPAGTQSGVTINSGSANDTIVATNALRRRVLLFVDRSDTFDGSNPPVNTPAAISVSETEIAPAVGGVNGSSVQGNLSGVIGATTSSPIPLLAVPTGQFGATYDVVAVGPGTSGSAPASFSPTEVSTAQQFLRRTFFTDFFLPVLNRICISNTLTQVQSNTSGATTIANLMDKAADAQAAGVDTFVTTNFASAQPDMSSGNFLGANAAVLTAIDGSSTTLNNVATYYSTFLQSVGGGFTPAQTNVNAVLAWMSSALKNVNVADLPTALPQYQGVIQSQVYSTWTVTQAAGDVVTLSPATSTITTTVGHDTQELTVSVNFGSAGQPAKSTLLYSWTTPGAVGDLVFPDNTNGTTSELNSTYSSAEYFADLANLSNSGSDVVTVKVQLKAADGTVTTVGSSSATITVGSSGYGAPQRENWLGSASGSPVNVTGGSFFIEDTTQNFEIWPDANNRGTVATISTVIGEGTGTPTLLDLIDDTSANPEPTVALGDTITVVFDCPVERQSPTGTPPTSISTSQDIHLFAPNTGKDLGVVIPAFTSNVGDTTTGSYNPNGYWQVIRTFTIPSS